LCDLDTEGASNDSVPGFVEGDPFLP